MPMLAKADDQCEENSAHRGGATAWPWYTLAACVFCALAGAGILIRAKLVGGAGSKLAGYTTFRPGQEWLDTDGNVIRAHSGGLLNDPASNRTFWYGSEAYPGGKATLNTRINVYSSDASDLMNWRYEGIAFEMPQQGRCMEPSPDPNEPMTCYADRCKVLFNPKTRNYIMWCKSKPFASVALASSPIGPFRLVNLLIPGGHEVGDCTAYTNPTHPSDAYFIISVHPSSYGFSFNETRQLKMFQLTPDWTNVAGDSINITPAWPLPNTHDGKLEAPAAFYDASAGKHYIWTSHCSGWKSNDAYLLESPLNDLTKLWANEEKSKAAFGWTPRGNPTDSDDTWASQSTQVVPITSGTRIHGSTEFDTSDGVHVASEAQWIYIADRFEPYIGMNETGRYVWLPIEKRGDRLVVDWHDEWRLPSQSPKPHAHGRIRKLRATRHFDLPA